MESTEKTGNVCRLRNSKTASHIRGSHGEYQFPNNKRVALLGARDRQREGMPMKQNTFSLGCLLALVVPIVLTFSTGFTPHCKPGPVPPNCEIVDTVKNNRCPRTGEAWVCNKTSIVSRSVDSQSKDTPLQSGTQQPKNIPLSSSKDQDPPSQPGTQQPKEALTPPSEDQ